MKRFWKRAAAQGGAGAAPPSGGGLRWQRWARKVHLYLGLVMWPFVLLFAVSALSFNHPAVARGLHQVRVPASDVAAHTGFEPPNARAFAEALVRELNLSAAKPAQGTSAKDSASTLDVKPRYELEGSPSFGGWALFAAPVTDGKQALILSLDSGWIDVTHRPAAQNPQVAPFDGWRISRKFVDFEKLSGSFGPLLERHGIALLGPVRAHPETHAELRLTIRDEHGARWQSKLDLVTGEVRASRAGSVKSTIADSLERIHTQHHYPAQVDATWYWALFADLTALTLLLWALTGIVMWWQQRKLRRIGVSVVAVALVGSVVLMSSVMNHQSFGPASEHE